jgi:hypothetical protein
MDAISSLLPDERSQPADTQEARSAFDHASVTLTLDRYGHVFPGYEQRPRGSSTLPRPAPSEAFA